MVPKTHCLQGMQVQVERIVSKTSVTVDGPLDYYGHMVLAECHSGVCLAYNCTSSLVGANLTEKDRLIFTDAFWQWPTHYLSSELLVGTRIKIP